MTDSDFEQEADMFRSCIPKTRHRFTPWSLVKASIEFGVCQDSKCVCPSVLERKQQSHNTHLFVSFHIILGSNTLPPFAVTTSAT